MERIIWGYPRFLLREGRPIPVSIAIGTETHASSEILISQYHIPEQLIDYLNIIV